MAASSARAGARARAAAADVRMQGFAERSSLEEAYAWIDAASSAVGPEAVEPGRAVGRVLAASPAIADGEGVRAAEDGYAVRAQDTVGAAPYNPLVLALQDARGGAAPLAPNAAALVVAGSALPPGADAVLAFAAAQAQGGAVEVLAPVAVGAGVERRGEALGTAAKLSPGRPLRPHDVALLAALGVARAEVVRRPRIRLLVAGPKPWAAGPVGDACGPMIAALLARDGAAAEPCAASEGRRGLASALSGAGGCDAVLVIGRSGVGPDDEAPLALADAGELALHGVALRPGGSTGLGRAGRAPVVLLPGDPLACFFGYELLAGRLVRRLGGRDPALPHPTREVELTRKIASMVGFADVCSVRLADAGAEPAGAGEEGGLAAAAAGDGFVVVPAPLEGYPAGARVLVHLFSRG